MNNRRLLALFSLFAILHPAIGHAQWAANGNTISAGVANQTGPRAASDGAGGAFVTWTDTRNGTADIYAQLINANGVVQWVSNGEAVRSATADQWDPRIVPDGAGGAIIAWTDDKGGSVNIFAQRIDNTGTAQWTVAGVTVCGAQNDQAVVSMIEDGAGGAILAWEDARSGSNQTRDIYAQRINASGTPLWAGDGVPVCTAASAQYTPTLVADGAGGAIITWSDDRDGVSPNIYVQRVNAAGAVQWTADGVALCLDGNAQDAPVIAGDGAGGAIVAWYDWRNGFTDIYARRVNAAGAPQWTADGVAICTAANAQVDPQIISDTAGGAIITWTDDRATGTGDNDLYAQRVDGAGAVRWTANGVALCTATGTQLFARVIPDGAGGAVVAWMDTRAGGLDYDMYAQRINASGAAQWAGNGVALCTAANGQFSPTLAPDGAGGALVAWHDFRSGTTNDIYGNRVTPGGAIPTGVGDTPAARAFVLGDAHPNPFSAGTTVELALPGAAEVSVEVFDVAGRRVRAMDLGRLAAGSTRLAFDGRDDRARALPSGVYFYRVRAAGATLTRKIVIQR
jgi:hypothetical protein